MSFLEKKIADNKAFFDDQPLPEGHLDRFIEKFKQPEIIEAKKENRSRWLKIAAAIVILISGSLILQQISMNQVMHSFFDGYYVIKLSPELEEMFSYYDEITQAQMDEIPQLTSSSDQTQKINEFAQRQLQGINANIAALEKEYAKFPDNEALNEALVNSKKQKAQIVESIVNMLNNNNLRDILPETINN
jgi:hypothetical protein